MAKPFPSILTYFLEDAAKDIFGITARAMFGGYGLYLNGKIFGIVADEVIYFKVDESNAADYEKYGANPFSYHRKNYPETKMAYYELPGEIMKNPAELKKWIEKSASLTKKK